MATLLLWLALQDPLRERMAEFLRLAHSISGEYRGEDEAVARARDAFAAASGEARPGLAAFARGEWERAQDLLTNDPDPDALLCRAHALHHLRRFEEAARLLDELRNAVPGRVDVRALRARALFAGRDYPAALAEATGVVEADPKNVDGWLTLAYVHRVKDQAEAMKALERAVALAPDCAEARALRAVERLSAEDLPGAEEDVESALRLNPRSPTAFLARASLRHARKDSKAALDDAGRAIELDPLSSHAHLRRGMIWSDAGDYAKAVADYTRAIELDPRWPTAYGNRGIAHFYAKRFDDARADYARALALDPAHVWTLHASGTLHMNRGDFAAAIADYTKALEIRPGYELTWRNRGACKLKLRDYDGAIRDLTRAIEANPALAYAYFQRGRAHELTGAEEKARADYDACVERDPRYADVRYHRGLLRLRGGDAAGAVEDLELTLKISHPKWELRGAAEEWLRAARERKK